MVESLAAKLNNISVEDIDAEDKENPLLCSEYINGIYDYMRVMEVQYQVININDNSYTFKIQEVIYINDNSYNIHSKYYTGSNLY